MALYPIGSRPGRGRGALVKPGGDRPEVRCPRRARAVGSGLRNQPADAGRGALQTNRFAAPAPRSMTLLTLLGYAVVEPNVPIVGPAGRMNDNYVPDLRNSLWAVIDDLDKKGIIDRDRLAIGGHSYGAFSTANALAHTPFFKAGIAGDGNYNRTLTSMTFQTERRQLWEARETYLEMSPLLWANRVNGALLMYHGMEDANVGTNPVNAEHLFMALDGLGKPAALYMYPYEGHGPLAKETTLDLWARWTAWLDTYVKNPKKETRPADTQTAGADEGRDD
jgi:dipeptidyl aminopeptidase/acylaminoacyl peptidase